MDSFLDYLFKLEENYYENLPHEIRNALGDIEMDKFGYDRTKLQRIKFFLMKYLALGCYGFNSGKLKLNI